MASTPQSQAIQIANELITTAQQLMNLYALITTTDAVWIDNNIGATLEALTTSAQNDDGSLGSPDAAPNPQHPIDSDKYPTLVRSLSATQIEQIKSILDGFVAFINGQAVTAQPAARAILNKAVGG